MKYPVTASIDLEDEYPYRFRLDLVDNGIKPKDQIPDLKNRVNSWLKEAGIDYRYRQGLWWHIKREQDAVLFSLKWS